MGDDRINKLAKEKFNATWDILDKFERTATDKLNLLNYCHASLELWKVSEGFSPTNHSIGLWLISRVYAEINIPVLALAYADACIEISANETVEPFFLAYAYEAKCRAQLLGGHNNAAGKSLKMAREVMQQSAEKDKTGLEADLTELQKKIAGKNDKISAENN
jgi:hypothetical protein